MDTVLLLLGYMYIYSVSTLRIYINTLVLNYYIDKVLVLIGYIYIYSLSTERKYRYIVFTDRIYI